MRRTAKTSSATNLLYKKRVKVTPWFRVNGGQSRMTNQFTYSRRPWILSDGPCRTIPVARKALWTRSPKNCSYRTSTATSKLKSAWSQTQIMGFVAQLIAQKLIDYVSSARQAYQHELALSANPPADVEINANFCKHKTLQSKLTWQQTDMKASSHHRLGLLPAKPFVKQQVWVTLMQNEKIAITSHSFITLYLIPRHKEKTSALSA